MTKQELDNLLMDKYMSFGIPKETAEKMLNDDRTPTALDGGGKQATPQVVKPSSNFTLKDRTETKAQSIANAAAINRGKKEDILNALDAFLRELSFAIDVDTIQSGKAGAIMFKNTTGDYFTLKLTLNKTKPNDFIE